MNLNYLQSNKSISAIDLARNEIYLPLNDVYLGRFNTTISDYTKLIDHNYSLGRAAYETVCNLKTLESEIYSPFLSIFNPW